MDAAVQISPKHKLPTVNNITYDTDCSNLMSFHNTGALYCISPHLRVEISPKRNPIKLNGSFNNLQRNLIISREYLIQADKFTQLQRKKDQDREQMTLKIMQMKEQDLENKLKIRSIKQERETNLHRKRADLYYLKKNDALKVKRDAYIAEKIIEASARSEKDEKSRRRNNYSLDLKRTKQIHEFKSIEKEMKRRKQMMDSLNSEYQIIKQKQEEVGTIQIKNLKHEEQSLAKDLKIILDMHNKEYLRLQTISEAIVSN